jgi:hypothetical protein
VIVLDAGALIALDNNDRKMWAELKAARNEVDIVVPVGALAQAWRGGGRQVRLALALRGTTPAGFDKVAKKAGELCAKAGTSDVIDASIAIVASRPPTLVLYTSDKADLDHLLEANGGHRPTVSKV